MPTLTRLCTITAVDIYAASAAAAVATTPSLSCGTYSLPIVDRASLLGTGRFIFLEISTKSPNRSCPVSRMLLYGYPPPSSSRPKQYDTRVIFRKYQFSCTLTQVGSHALAESYASFPQTRATEMPKTRRSTPPKLANATKGDRTRQRLLKCAMKVIARQGIADLSVPAINAGAGVSQGTFYLYFKDRWDIVRQLIKEVSEDIRVDMDAREIGITDPAERVAFAIQCLIHYYRTKREMGWVLVRINEVNTPAMRQLRRPVSRSLVDDLRRGRSSGRFQGTN